MAMNRSCFSFLPARADRRSGIARTLCTGGGFPYPRGDIYFSRRVNGKWTQAQHLEHGVNTVADEGAPALTPDEKQLIFASERSPFVIPMLKRIDMAEFERLVHATLNGHWNIYYDADRRVGA